MKEPLQRMIPFLKRRERKSRRERLPLRSLRFCPLLGTLRDTTINSRIHADRTDQGI